jgi:hypothetical protein
MLHINRMVFGAPEQNHSGAENAGNAHLPFSCRLALILAAVPVLVLGFYIPQPLNELLTQAAATLTK